MKYICKKCNGEGETMIFYGTLCESCEFVKKQKSKLAKSL